MKTLFKIIGYILLAITLLIAGFGYFTFKKAYGTEKIEGTVYDCQSKQPIAGVSLRFPQNFFDALIGGLSSTKDTVVETDRNGHFEVENKGTSFSLAASKDGYLNASEYGNNINKFSFGLMKRSPSDSTSEYTQGCKRSAECIVDTTLPNGTIESRNTCGPVSL